MSKFLEPLPLFALAGLGTAAVLGSAVLVANSFQPEERAVAPAGGLVTAAQAQETAEPAPEGGSAAADAAPQDAVTAPPSEPPAEEAATADAGSGGATATEVAAEPPAPSRSGGFGLGREALPEEVAAWDIDVRPDGQGLPEGSGDVWTGEELFVAKCAACHGDFGEGAGRWPELAGGFGTLDGDDPVKTVGSFWPYLSTAVDYIHRAMPFGEAQSLTADEVYAITAYLLYLNEVVEEDFVLSPETFASVEMPNAEGFFDDDRDAVEVPQFSAEPCMEGCKESVEITMRAAVLDVTPDDGGDEAGAVEEPALAEAIEGADAAEAEPAVAEAVEQPAEEEPQGEAEVAQAEAEAAPEAAEAVEAVAEEEPQGEAEPAAAADAAAEPAAAEPAALDMALVAEGEGVFRRCTTCHEVGEGAQNRTGPVLNGVVGRVIGTYPDYRYSEVLEEAGAAGRTWSAEELSGYLADPREHMPGTKMSFPGLRSEEEIAAVIEFLRSHAE